MARISADAVTAVPSAIAASSASLAAR